MESRILAHSQPVIERQIRHRWIAVGIGSSALLGMMAAFAIAPTSPDEQIRLETVVEQLSTTALVQNAHESSQFLHEEQVQRSDSFQSLLGRLGIVDQEALDFIKQHPRAQNVARQLRPGQLVSATTDDVGRLRALYMPLSGKDALLIIERRAGRLTVDEQALAFETQTLMQAGEIRYSLFGATDAAGIPDAIATQLAEIFSADIDFHRDLRKSDRFSLVYEVFRHKGRTVRSGRILSAEFINNQKIYQAFWFKTDGNAGGYYSADGKSLRKAFLRSPLEFSRVTSGFSNARFHPVLQTWRAHRGVDYGAPTGTRVRAVADGIVEHAGWQGGYGNLVVVKHQGSYSTAYGHLNGFGQGVRKGARVMQGETIGSVGQTGLASGPHLHYEFRVNSQPVNPVSIALPAATPLQPAQIQSFKSSIEPLRTLLTMTSQTKLALTE